MNEFYDLLLLQAESVVSGENDLIANLSNISALLFDQLTLKGTKVNWVGFYLQKNDQLVLGPFQGLSFFF